MFKWTEVEKKVSLHKSTFDENKCVHYCFMRLDHCTFNCDTDVVKHSRYTGRDSGMMSEFR